jgi:hypothetical protein
LTLLAERWISRIIGNFSVIIANIVEQMVICTGFSTLFPIYFYFPFSLASAFLNVPCNLL